MLERWGHDLVRRSGCDVHCRWRVRPAVCWGCYVRLYPCSIRWLNGVVYRLKKSGPRTEPWGTPQESGRGWGEWLHA